MTDINKVIKRLHAHADGCGYRSHYCDDMECPYRYGDESCDIDEMCRDALVLLTEYQQCAYDTNRLIVDLQELIAVLKEKEPIKPVFECEEPMLKLGQFHCGNCHQSFGISLYRYCPFCGRKQKWE